MKAVKVTYSQVNPFNIYAKPITEIRYCAYGNGAPAGSVPEAVAKCMESMEANIAVEYLGEPFDLHVEIVELK